ncbi:MAG: cell division protein FtsX [Candidatus Dormibacteraceae bacterium]
MRPWRHLLFALSTAWQSFWRNAAVSFAAILSITLILMLAGVSLLLGHALSGVLDSYKAKVSMLSISIADATPLTSVYDFESRLRAAPGVTSVRFVTKQQELARFAHDPGNRQIVQEMEGNPLAARIEVQVARLGDLAGIDHAARQWRGADRTNPTDYQGTFITRMLQLSRWLTLAGLVMLGVLVVVSIVIVMNTIRTAVYHRRQEIEVMRLVGATDWFVRGPFVIEGILTGTLAASVSLGVLAALYHPFVTNFRSQLFFIPLSYDPGYVNQLARVLLVGGAALGALGSYIGVRRFVRI